MLHTDALQKDWWCAPKKHEHPQRKEQETALAENCRSRDEQHAAQLQGLAVDREMWRELVDALEDATGVYWAVTAG